MVLRLSSLSGPLESCALAALEGRLGFPALREPGEAAEHPSAQDRAPRKQDPEGRPQRGRLGLQLWTQPLSSMRRCLGPAFLTPP